MKAYLIDPFAKTITEVEYTGEYTNIYEHIGVDCFTALTINNARDTIFLDDEGLFREGQKYFLLHKYPQPLPGKGLVLGTDDQGESVSPVISIMQLEQLITFPAVEITYKRMDVSEEPADVFGRPGVRINHIPVFEIGDSTDDFSAVAADKD